MKFYDLMLKNLKITGLINSVFKLTNNEVKAGIEIKTKNDSNSFIGFNKESNELVASNDGVNFFPIYVGDEISRLDGEINNIKEQFRTSEEVLSEIDDVLGAENIISDEEKVSQDLLSTI